ncbi:MAG: hypothetical protein GXO36_00285 [Chloroflexi bacterium]|nr:hypothetical protein [Chloroflexota bacterium]
MLATLVTGDPHALQPPVQFGYQDPVTLNVFFGAATWLTPEQRRAVLERMQTEPQALHQAWLDALEWFDPQRVTLEPLGWQQGEASTAVRMTVRLNEGEGPEWALELGAFVRGPIAVVLGEGYVRTWSRVPPVDWQALAQTLDQRISSQILATPTP